MADCSLDEYIVKTNKPHQFRKQQQGIGARLGKKQPVGFPQQKKLIQQQQHAKQKVQQHAKQKIQVTGQVQDARQKLTRKPVQDARQKLMAKSKMVDARIRIQNKTGQNKTLDARSKINKAKQQKQVFQQNVQNRPHPVSSILNRGPAQVVVTNQGDRMMAPMSGDTGVIASDNGGLLRVVRSQPAPQNIQVYQQNFDTGYGNDNSGCDVVVTPSGNIERTLTTTMPQAYMRELSTQEEFGDNPAPHYPQPVTMENERFSVQRQNQMYSRQSNAVPAFQRLGNQRSSPSQHQFAPPRIHSAPPRPLQAGFHSGTVRIANNRYQSPSVRITPRLRAARIQPPKPSDPPPKPTGMKSAPSRLKPPPSVSLSTGGINNRLAPSARLQPRQRSMQHTRPEFQSRQPPRMQPQARLAERPRVEQDFDQELQGPLRSSLVTAAAILEQAAAISERIIPYQQQSMLQPPQRQLPQQSQQSSFVLRGVNEYVQEEEREDDPLPVQDVVSPIQGFKVIVKNLHPIVTQDDLLELFGALGPLRKAKILKKGLAEMVFIKKKDALAAVKKYHMRELDGQPMTVMLLGGGNDGGSVNVSTPIRKTQPAKPGKSLSLLKTPAGSTLPESIVDSTVLHRALFKSTVAAAPAPPVTFRVKI